MVKKKSIKSWFCKDAAIINSLIALFCIIYMIIFGATFKKLEDLFNGLQNGSVDDYKSQVKDITKLSLSASYIYYISIVLVVIGLLYTIIKLIMSNGILCYTYSLIGVIFSIVVISIYNHFMSNEIKRLTDDIINSNVANNIKSSMLNFKNNGLLFNLL